jgi:hypothetical protein
MRTFVSSLTGLTAVLFAATWVVGCDGDGASGKDALVNVSPEPAGKNCKNGGSRIDSGVDQDGNNALDEGEVQSTAYACNGADGADGASAGGAPAGADGANGHGALVAVSAAEEDPTCPGGRQVDSGVDLNDDGKLGSDEVISTFSVCGGIAGKDGADAVSMLLSVSDEAAGANCAEGGQKITAGPDKNGDGTFDADEIEQTEYVCNGADGPDGLDSLASVTTEAAGANCANGGLRIDLGIDDDASATLEAGEIDATRYVCDGAAGPAGVNSLVSVVAEAAGANCTNGGQRITYGLDADRNNVLDAGEVTATRFACNGAPGKNGLNALIKLTAEPAGMTCAAGGQRIDSGMDDDDNGVLAAGEIDATTYVCNGDM